MDKRILEAAAWTFLQAFVASLTIANVENMGALKSALISAGVSAMAATLSLIKSYIVRNMGETDSIFLSGGNND